MEVAVVEKKERGRNIINSGDKAGSVGCLSFEVSCCVVKSLRRS